MHAIGLRHKRRLEIVVDDKGNVTRNHTTQTTALLDEIARRGVLVPQLDERRAALRGFENALVKRATTQPRSVGDGV